MDGQEASEALRQVVKNDFTRTLHANPSQRIARHVDEDVFDRRVEALYRQYRDNIHRTVGDDPALEKARDRYGSGYHVGEFDLADSFEGLYWEHYSEGVNGEEYPSKPGTNVVCQMCKLEFAMSGKMTPLKCPRCGYITPLGRMVQDGYYKR